MANEKIIIVDDEPDMREFLSIMLRKEGYEVAVFASAVDALSHCMNSGFDLAITDVRMPDMDGVDFLKNLKEIAPSQPVIMITAYASVDTAIEAMKAGAYDYFTKPFKVDEIRLTIKKALKLLSLERENRLLKDELRSARGFGNLIGSSKSMKDVYSLIKSVAKTKTNVFITGESGTGKELVARAIHTEGDRNEKPFVAINCGAIPENLIESELFGHQKGAFTGAVSNKEGLAEVASGGTIFFDEVTELPLAMQVKLLRFIQERTFRRVGGTADISVDVRIIAASNRDVEAEVRQGRFREDLFYRLNVIRVEMPPLRERKEDIPFLARFFVDKYSAEFGKKVERITEPALKLLMDYEWSGNVRELENVMERSVALESTEAVTTDSLPSYIREAGVSPLVSAGEQVPEHNARAAVVEGGVDLESLVAEYEKGLILDALSKAGGVRKKAAELLGLTFRSMRYKLAKYDISVD